MYHSLPRPEFCRSCCGMPLTWLASTDSPGSQLHELLGHIRTGPAKAQGAVSAQHCCCYWLLPPPAVTPPLLSANRAGRSQLARTPPGRCPPLGSPPAPCSQAPDPSPAQPLPQSVGSMDLAGWLRALLHGSRICLFLACFLCRNVIGRSEKGALFFPFNCASRCLVREGTALH